MNETVNETTKCRNLHVDSSMHHWLEEGHCIVGTVALPHAAVLDFFSSPNVKFHATSCRLAWMHNAAVKPVCAVLSRAALDLHSQSACASVHLNIDLFTASMQGLSNSIAMEPIRVPCSWSVDSSWVDV